MTGDGGGWMLVTADMVSDEILRDATAVHAIDGLGGLVHTTYANNRGCGIAPNSAAMNLLADDVPWTAIRYDMVFMGSNSCWGIFGDTHYHREGTTFANLIPFAPGVDVVRDTYRMGGSSGDAFDGVPYRCDNTTTNFWHQNNGGAERRASVVLRRDTCEPGEAGFSVGVSCTNYGGGTTSPTYWTHKNIYVR